MIKVGIIGAESLVAGELLRLLLHHPEVELKWVYSSSLKGLPLFEHHRGLIGETELRFSERPDFDTVDVVFVSSDSTETEIPMREKEDLKVVVLQDDLPLSTDPQGDETEYVPAVSEMFRKKIVREARAVKVLSSAASISLIALFPLALHLMLNDTVSIKVSLPSSLMSHIHRDGLENELESLLSKVQLSFDKIKDLTFETTENLRAVSVDIFMDSSVDRAEIEKLYNEVYDDHNFSFVVSSPRPEDVAGTQKCLIEIEKPSEDRLHIHAVADGLFRGGSGDAIHAMNLLFGLFEKTGLTFPAGLAFKSGV